MSSSNSDHPTNSTKHKDQSKNTRATESTHAPHPSHRKSLPQAPTFDLPEEDERFLIQDQPSLEIELSIQNNTSGTQVPDSPPHKVLQLLEKAIILEVPEKICAVGHAMTIFFRCTGLRNETTEFTVTVKVQECEHYEDHRDQIKVKLIQYPEAPWDLLTRFLDQRQKEIETYLEAVGD